MNKTIIFMPFTRTVQDDIWEVSRTITDVKGFTSDGNRVSFVRHEIVHDLETGRVVSDIRNKY